jgi:large subunit ribosomal protein L21
VRAVGRAVGARNPGPGAGRAHQGAGLVRRGRTCHNFRFVSFILIEVPMYAVIKTGGKQYKVAAGDKIKIEQMPADIGTEITLDQVLAVGSGESIVVGAPLVAGATVSVTVLAQGRHDKVRIFKMRRRKHYRKRQGHRQNYTEVLISRIASSLGESVAPAAV